MKKSCIYMFFLLLASMMFLPGCREHYITYEDKEYVMFADTAMLYVVREDIPEFDVPIVSTVACDHDRNFAVEILEPQSTAADGRDYTIEDCNFVIKAGERVGYVKVKGLFDALDPEKRLELSLKLIVPDNLVMPVYGDRTILRFQKTNKFNRERFTGWAVVSSMFLYQYSLTGRYQRLVHTEPDPDDANGVIIRSFLADGYDVKIVFDDDTDPAAPRVITPAGQVVSDEASVFGMIHGDNRIMIETGTQASSYFLGHAGVALLMNRFYVQNIGDDIGTVGNFYTELDWVSDEEARRLRNEEGM